MTGIFMINRTKIHAAYEHAMTRKQELSEKLKHLEDAEPKSFHDIWVTRDQIAYWQGMAEGLLFALHELSPEDN